MTMWSVILIIFNSAQQFDYPYKILQKYFSFMTIITMTASSNCRLGKLILEGQQPLYVLSNIFTHFQLLLERAA